MKVDLKVIAVKLDRYERQTAALDFEIITRIAKQTATIKVERKREYIIYTLMETDDETWLSCLPFSPNEKIPTKRLVKDILRQFIKIYVVDILCL